jgi:hypothetical protein
MSPKGEIQSSSKTVTTVHHEAGASVSFDIENNPVKVKIFDEEYYLNYAYINEAWESDKQIPEASLTVSYVSILKSGKAGEKYGKRTFNASDIGKYIVGEEETFSEIFKKYYRTAEKVVKEKAVA